MHAVNASIHTGVESMELGQEVRQSTEGMRIKTKMYTRWNEELPKVKA